MEENIIPKRVLYMNLETTRWQDEVREDGRIGGREEWQEKVYDREEWKKLLRTAQNRRILHMPMEQNRIENCIQYTTYFPSRRIQTCHKGKQLMALPIKVTYESWWYLQNHTCVPCIPVRHFAPFITIPK
jgi:hypothetical protein